jgi:hypothetical protein
MAGAFASPPAPVERGSGIDVATSQANAGSHVDGRTHRCNALEFDEDFGAHVQVTVMAVSDVAVTESTAWMTGSSTA